MTCTGNCAVCTNVNCPRNRNAAAQEDKRPAATSSHTGKDATGAQRGGGSTRFAEQTSQSKGDPCLLYVYDGSLEGFLTAVFETYARHEQPYRICPPQNLQVGLLERVVTIETCEDEARRVAVGLRKKLGADEFERVHVAFLSDDADRGAVICRYIHHAMRVGKRAIFDHAHPDTLAFEHLWKQVYNERHKILQFLRFSQMEGGVWFARINPTANVVPLVMEHFSARFNTQPFLIYDEVHHIAGAYDLQGWQLIATDDITPPDFSPEEREYRAMWKTFYDTICNRERYNPALRRSFMPMRLWKNLTEFALD